MSPVALVLILGAGILAVAHARIFEHLAWPACLLWGLVVSGTLLTLEVLLWVW